MVFPGPGLVLELDHCEDRREQTHDEPEDLHDEPDWDDRDHQGKDIIDDTHERIDHVRDHREVDLCMDRGYQSHEHEHERERERDREDREAGTSDPGRDSLPCIDLLLFDLPSCAEVVDCCHD